MQKPADQQYRVSISPLAAKRLRALALAHNRSERQLINELIGRQFKHDQEHGNLHAAIDKLNDADTDEMEDGQPG